MLGRALTGSEIKYVTALSPGAFGAAGSSDSVDFSDFEFGTLIVHAGSVNTGFEAHVLRSGTSNGTFQGIGASIGFNAGGGVGVRSFSMQSSAVHYKVYYTNGTGSANVGILLVGQQPRKTPINQDSSTTVYSSILNA